MTVGVLLINLGTPQAPTTQAVKAFIKPFLQDRRVVDTHPLIWYPLLNFIILPKRTPIVADIYKRIWMQEGSPLLVYTQRLAENLQHHIQSPVEIGMTYGEPSIQSGIDKLVTQGVSCIRLLPLFPQYSTTTTLPVWDQIEKLQALYSEITFERVDGYATQPCYIHALSSFISAYWDKNGKPDALLCSYHGIPQRYTREKNDPYAHICAKNTDLLSQQLAMAPDKILYSFQSHFGKEEWLMPYTEEELTRLAQSGIQYLDVVTPSFACDCIETLHEIQIEGEHQFKEAGGLRLRLIPCLNDSIQHIEALTQIINL